MMSKAASWCQSNRFIVIPGEYRRVRPRIQDRFGHEASEWIPVGTGMTALGISSGKHKTTLPD
jgi:hypothetical protein